MIEYHVESRDGVVAAILAAAELTHEAAGRNPFTVTVEGLPGFKMTFRRGVTQRRAERLVQSIRSSRRSLWS